MHIQHRCKSCGQKYEISWQEPESAYSEDYFDDDGDDDVIPEDDPCFCPFCGSHCYESDI